MNRAEQNRLVQLEEACNNHLVQLPNAFRAHQHLMYVVKGIVQMPFYKWQAYDTDHLSRKPVHVFDHSLKDAVKECIFPMSFLNFLTQLGPFP